MLWRWFIAVPNVQTKDQQITGGNHQIIAGGRIGCPLAARHVNELIAGQFPASFPGKVIIRRMFVLVGGKSGVWRSDSKSGISHGCAHQAGSPVHRHTPKP